MDPARADFKDTGRDADIPDSNPSPGPNAGKPPKPKSEPPILLRLAPLWRLRLCPKKSSKGSSAVKGIRQRGLVIWEIPGYPKKKKEIFEPMFRD